MALYVSLNFERCLVLAEGGVARRREGHYTLESHGRILRELTEREYVAFRANETRLFSGHWLIFYFVPLAWFAFRRDAVEQEARA